MDLGKDQGVCPNVILFFLSCRLTTTTTKKLLEGMPPTELFADLDAVRASTAAGSGLPTRKRLEQWLIEHDKIEKETEIFDSGELKKFKNFTMGQYPAVFLFAYFHRR
jgi:hypothetical protein